jgi:ribosomal protein L6P/L9E
MTDIRIKRKRYLVLMTSVSGTKPYVMIKGPLGTITFPLPPTIKLCINKGGITKLFVASRKCVNVFYAKLRRTIKGLLYGYFVQIHTEGVGFKFMRHQQAPQLLTLSLGHSHLIHYKFPNNVKFRCLKYKLLLFCNRKSLLSDLALRIKVTDHLILIKVRDLNSQMRRLRSNRVNFDNVDTIPCFWMEEKLCFHNP